MNPRRLERRPAAAPRGGKTAPPTQSMKRRTALRRKRAIRPWWYGFLVSVGLMTVLAAGAVGVFLAIIYNMSPDDPLEYYTPAEVTRIYDRDGARLIGEFRNPDGEQRILVRLEEIPKRLQQAFLAIEDARFEHHFGIDTIGVIRAFYKLFTGSGFEGASTITMQLPRNTGMIGREQTWSRKIREAFLAVWIERHYSKSQILEVYLNQISLGGNVCGVRLAADKYFSKDLNELTLAECALLAAIPKSPTAYNPLLYPDAALERRNIVLKRMNEVGWITDKEYQQAKAEPMILHPGKRQAGSGSLYPYFVDGLETDLKRFYREELLQLDAELNGKVKPAEAKRSRNGKASAATRVEPVQRALQTAGLRITSTIDPAIQEISQRALRQGLIDLEKIWQSKKPERQAYENKKWSGQFKPGDVKLMEIIKVADDRLNVRLRGYHGQVRRPEVLPFYDPAAAIKAGKLLDVRVTEVDDASGEIKGEFADTRPMQGSLVVLDAHTAEVLALAGGSGFASEQSGWINAAMINSRQMGSCFKPFFYAAAFDKGYQPNDIIVDERIEYGRASAPYRPSNYERDGSIPIFFGPNTLIEALEHSRNVTTIRLFEAMGIAKGIAAVRKFDFAYGYENPQWKIDPYYPSCLGSVSSSPFVMASAYQVFPNGGVGVRPQFIRAITNNQDRIPFPVKRPEFEVVKPLSAYQSVYLMRQVITQIDDGATGREVGRAFPSPPFPPIAGKTGTTDDCRDAWFAGFTPDLVIVAQIGFEPWRSMAPGMTGGTTAGKYIWIKAFEEIYKTRRNWRMSYDAPEEPIEFADICRATGKRASNVCSESGHKIFHDVPFALGKTPAQPCNGEISVPLIAPMPSGDYGSYASISPIRGVAHPITGGYD